MTQDLHQEELSRTARVFHAALAHYERCMRSGSDIESAAQTVVGTGVKYRIALDKAIRKNPSAVHCRNRLAHLRRALTIAARQYNLRQKTMRVTR